RKKYGFLQDKRELISQVSDLELAYVNLVEEDLAFLRVIKAREQTDQRRLAAACRADDSHAGSGPYFKRNILENPVATAVGERYLPKNQATSRAAQGSAIRPFNDFRRF